MKVYCEFEVIIDEEPQTIRVWLCGDPELPQRLHSDVSAESRQFQRTWQTRGGAGWQFQELVNRGNKTVIWEGSTDREFASETARADFLADLGDEDQWMPFPPKANVYFRVEEGNEWKDTLMANAAIEVISCEIIGAVGLRMRFRITGKKTTTSTPYDNTGTYDWLLDSNGERLQDSDGRYLHSDLHET
jgi:hypothetical protein